MIESSIVRGYRRVALDTNANSLISKTTEIIAPPSSIENIRIALAKLEKCAPHFMQLFQSNVDRIVCVGGAYSNTFPATRSAVIDAKVIDEESTKELVRRLVFIASYIEFYESRFIFLPQLFQRRTDAGARVAANLAAEGAASAVSTATPATLEEGKGVRP